MLGLALACSMLKLFFLKAFRFTCFYEAGDPHYSAPAPFCLS